ncbi:MAG: IPT/TIG domain-containing protein, partial [Myxococcota bacterium]|nr:IPT/TIG domain-containing protein [Myxococcota bacterium]
MLHSTRSFSLIASLLLLSACLTAEPYWEGNGPPLEGVSPALENGNLGGGSMALFVEDLTNLSEEETTLLEAYIVTVSGNFGDCDDDLRIQFGNRNATLLARRDDALQVLTPPGPVAGGKVDVSVTCDFGASVLRDSYDYVLADPGDLDDDEPRRMEDLFQNEYASFVLQYGAEPFINQPDPYGYGFFFNQPAPRACTYYGGNPGMMYAGEASDEPGSYFVLPQSPEIPYDAPEQGDRIRAGDSITFFRPRNTSDPTEILTAYARKIANSNPLFPEGPAPDSPTQRNNGGAWMGIPYSDDDGFLRVRYLRLGNDIGRVCNPLNTITALAPGCTGDEEADDRVNDTLLPVDFRWKWMTPDRPDQEQLALYPSVSPEHVAYLDCLDTDGDGEDDGDPDVCEAESGILLPSGDYDNAFICRSFDEDEDFPWVEDGFCIMLEVLGTVSIEQGSRYVQVGTQIEGNWTLDPDSNFYGGVPDGLENSVGENVLARGTPVWISYDEGFYRGDLVPAKNLEREVPAHTPPPMGVVCMDESGDLTDRTEGCEDGEEVVSSYDETPYIEIAPIEFSTFFGSDSPFDSYQRNSDGRVFGGFPILFAMDEPVDLRISLPGGTLSSGTERSDDMTEGGWDDTYFIVTLSVRDIDRPTGLDYDSVWSATAWAWAGDDYITFPAETLATLPEIADAFRPDTEEQKGSAYIGIIRLQVHRTAGWLLGDDFRDQSGRFLFDINAETLGYFHNQHSCFDGIDNDGDGLCDVDGCNDENGERLEPDPACIPASPDDDQPEYETAVCSDGEDNDEDGLIDMDDPDCTDPNDGFEDSGCIDGVDNDGDGWTDFPADPGCGAATDEDEGGYSYASDCNNGVDDDGDGRIDSQDPGCADALDDDETLFPDADPCTDGIDNNGDGWIDWADLTCRPGADYPDGENEVYPIGAEGFECSDADLLNGPYDNDGDGLINADDPECLFGWDPSGESGLPAACSDNIDNDCDGWVDSLDPQCISNPLSESVGGEIGGTCNDGLDNEGDGWIDALDPDCLSGNDDELSLSTPLECNDGLDNDGDGFVDGADEGCWTGKDNHEDPHAGEATEPPACVPNEVDDPSCLNISVVLPDASTISLSTLACDGVSISGRADSSSAGDANLHSMQISYSDAGCDVTIDTRHCGTTGGVPFGADSATLTVDLANC